MILGIIKKKNEKMKLCNEANVILSLNGSIIKIQIYLGRVFLRLNKIQKNTNLNREFTLEVYVVKVNYLILVNQCS